MSYYEYEDVKIAMYHALQKKEGWKLYGYKADESDLMTDYYSPAHWGGIGVKNGYILCVNVYGEEKERNTGTETIPAHQANPSRCNWHIEKDGVIIEKGSGLLKFSKLENYFIYPQYKEELEKFKKYENQKDEWISLEIERLENSYYSSDLEKIAESNYEKMSNILKLYRQFQALINKIDCACGTAIDGCTYEKKIVTEYKKENKVFIDETGEKKQGQCFVLNTNFNYGCIKGFVYQIQEIKYNDGKIGYCAYKMNGKLTKICTGLATRSNYWYIDSGEHDNLSRHIKNGSISWCHIEEVRTPYEVEKLVKVDTKNRKAPEQPQTEKKETLGNYTVEKSTHMKTGETIYIVKPIEKLSKEKYMQEKKKMVENGGYYSRFTHGFIFKKFPSFLAAVENEKSTDEVKEEFAKIEKPSFEKFRPFEIKEGQEEQTKQNKPDFETYEKIDFSKFEEFEQEEKQEEKQDLTFEITNENEKFYVKLKKTFENLQYIKRKFSTIGGFYSSNRNCFIFKENPAEKLKELRI